MKYRWDSCNLHLLINNRFNLPGNIFSFQHRNLFQIFLTVFCRLILFQSMSAFYQTFLLFKAQTFLIFLQLFIQFSVKSGCTAFFRFNDHDRTMLVIQKISLDQIFKISGIDLIFQKLKCIQRLDMNEWLFIIIEPAVHDLKSIHQPLRVTSKICLTITEFMIINSGFQRFFVHPFFNNIPKSTFNRLNKCCLLI